MLLVVYTEKSELKIADMWLISLDCVTCMANKMILIYIGVLFYVHTNSSSLRIPVHPRCSGKSILHSLPVMPEK